MSINDLREVEITCPNCGAVTKRTVAWIRTNKFLTCCCGATFGVSTQEKSPAPPSDYSWLKPGKPEDP